MKKQLKGSKDDNNPNPVARIIARLFFDHAVDSVMEKPKKLKPKKLTPKKLTSKNLKPKQLGP